MNSTLPKVEATRGTGPGRGKDVKALTSFDGLIYRLKVTKPIVVGLEARQQRSNMTFVRWRA
jgi:hypothetical protein